MNIFNSLLITMLLISCGQYQKVNSTNKIALKTDASLILLETQYPKLTYSNTGEKDNLLKITSGQDIVRSASPYVSGTSVSLVYLEYFKEYNLTLYSRDVNGNEKVTYSKKFRLNLVEAFSSSALNPMWLVIDKDNYLETPSESVAENFNGELIIKGRGADLFNDTHEFVGIYLNDLKNDFDVSLKINMISPGNNLLKTGLTIANNLQEFSDKGVVSCLQTYGSGMHFSFSTNEDEFMDVSTGSGNNNIPKFIRMKKDGNEISCYYRESESDSWVVMNGSPLVRNFSNSFDLGIVGSSNDINSTGIFRYEEFKEISP